MPNLLQQTANMTPAGQQTNQTMQAMQTILSSGQTLNQPMVDQANQGVFNANVTQAQLGTEAGRQPYLDNTNLNAQQGNYDALAKKLAEYDNMVLRPEFGGTNPGVASDVESRSGGAYFNPNLSYNTTNAQTPEQVLYNANPVTALKSQADQASSIVTLLENMNKILRNESKRGTAKYTSDLSNAARMLTGFTDILGQNTDLTKEKARIASAAEDRNYNRSKDAQDYNLELKKLGLQVDSKTGEITTATGSTLKGSAAVAEVVKQGGAKLLSQVTNPAQKVSIAEDILAAGGVKEYRNLVPLKSLLNKDQEKAETAMTEMMLSMDRAMEVFQGGDKLGGTGPIAGILNANDWNPFRSENTKEMNRLAGAITANYQKMLSGVAISDKERARLEKFLPTGYKNESTNLDDLKTLHEGIQANLELFELSVREGLTPNEAYQKYGKEVLTKYGADVSGDKTNNKTTSSGFTIKEVK